ncbi:unnamed protein product [Spodoptera littoralis]|uniref:Uncharacterized protein n=1 Tax=Spodoptera littoralis TaxID=7109 RepID=A0A9P0MY43_SPOLI|nr:unnamed protein product [Spodoptera littoralis]CAH1637667.1 unnamed protein product [Spodoptera littoralis]
MCPKYPHRHYNVSKGTQIILNVFGHNFKYRLNQYLSGPIHTRTYIKLTPSFADCTSPIITTGKKAFFFIHLYIYLNIIRNYKLEENMAIDYVSTTPLQPRGYNRTTRGAHTISIKIIGYRFNHATI